MSASDEAKKALEGVTPGPWCVEGDPWNQIVWSGLDNRVCFMAHSNGLDDDRDVATARFIAWAREGVPAMLAEIAAKDAEIARLTAQPSPDVEALVSMTHSLIAMVQHAIGLGRDVFIEPDTGRKLSDAFAAIARVKGRE